MVWKEQFSWKKFKFQYDNPEQIVLCQWQTDLGIPTAYLLFRMVFLAFFLGIWYAGIRMMYISFGCGCLKVVTKGSILLYYTTWSEIFCSVAAASSCLMTTIQYILDEDGEEENGKRSVFECRWWFRVHLVIYTLALDSSVALAFGYFGYVYYNERRYYRGISYVLHLWTGVMMLLDFMLSTLPTNLLHVYLAFGISAFYGFFSWVYYMLGGKDYLGEKYLYEVLNWEDDPWAAILAILGTLLFYIVVRLIVFCMYVLRGSIFYKHYYLATEEALRKRTFVSTS
ncbi:hypothetical protein HHI36_018783 [Cryptolaemus montrouzieri]|uniref:Protein rolling stone n=1 Tax=Cryptolaemus montrouzieri TaxID=559131 RepID=A0ABD2P128_9CUCU